MQNFEGVPSISVLIAALLVHHFEMDTQTALASLARSRAQLDRIMIRGLRNQSEGYSSSFSAVVLFLQSLLPLVKQIAKLLHDQVRSAM